MSVRFSFQGPRHPGLPVCVGVANLTRGSRFVNFFFTTRFFFPFAVFRGEGFPLRGRRSRRTEPPCQPLSSFRLPIFSASGFSFAGAAFSQNQAAQSTVSFVEPKIFFFVASVVSVTE